MRVETLEVLCADEGKVLTDGKEVYGEKLYLEDGLDESSFHEITKEEYEATLPKLEEI